MAENKEKKVVNSMMTSGMRKAFRDLPVEKRRYIQDLDGTETPLHPIPPDPYEGVTYVTFHEPKCSICSSPYRTELEHAFLSNGESANSVSHYFWHYYGVMVNPAAIKQHMNKHCVLNEIVSSGLAQLQKRSEDSDWLRFKRSDLVLTGLLSQIDRVEAIRTKNNVELELKKSAEMRALLAAYSVAQKQFEEEAAGVISVRTALADIMSLITDEPSRDIIRKYVNELRTKMRGDLS